ncbi:amino acid adenylation domain-containing protein [Sorangium sp. So ce291]|uniref:amino acid adenylation domain-containing protein n=1 Tax=Sorangium sp. So ce291 TaxID=3133294 RepID=UPI003F5ED033
MNTSDSGAAFETLVDLGRCRAARQRDELAYRFLVDGEDERLDVSFAEIDRRARAVGAALQAISPPGERAVLLYAPGLDYVAAFLGCLYAGVVAVPAYPPDPARLGRTLPRLEAIAADAGARVVLTTDAIAAMGDALAAQAPALRGGRWVSTDALAPGVEEAWRPPAISRGTLALLQYTSGSTGSPRGVMLTHGNLLANLAAISRGFGSSRASRGVIWLPPFHDMGLIGGVLEPLYAAFPVALMSPLSFLASPLRWLRAISSFGGTISGGPNFAYDLCARKATAADVAALDLSSWEVAFTGAEPVRHETLERFAAAFAPCGFRREAFYPCYGLAEGTLIVTGGERGAGPALVDVDRAALEGGRAAPPGPGRAAQTLVGCGSAVDAGGEVRIVDLVSGRDRADGEVGEIWVRGPSVARGYWGRAEATAEVFGGRRADAPGEGPYLRTGDLGALRGGALFVTGRLKDLIIVRGRNLYPDDLERTAEASHPALRRGCCAAFSVEADGEERLVIVQEVDARGAPDLAAVVAAVRREVLVHHDVAAHEVVLIQRGTIPKTSSGKIQRGACRAAFLAGDLEELARGALDAGAPDGRAIDAPATEMEREVASIWREVIGAERVGATDSFFEMGGDSLAAMQVVGRVEARTGLRVELSALFEEPTVRGLARRLDAAAAARPAPAAGDGGDGGDGARSEPIPRAPDAVEHPLSYEQERLWILDQLLPGLTAYNLAPAARLRGALDREALERALVELVRRHAALRTTFAARPDPVQRIGEGADVPVRFVDVSGQAEAERERAVRLAVRAELTTPFDLAAGPLLRVRLVRLGPADHVLVLGMHHIATDGWSFAPLVRDLCLLYESCSCGGGAALAPPTPPAALHESCSRGGGAALAPPTSPAVRYVDFARWQRRTLAGAHLEALVSWWTQRLRGLPTLELPTDRPRGSVQTFAGAERTAALPPRLLGDLDALCQRAGVTRFMAWLAVLAVVLKRATGQDDLAVGTAVANRPRPELEGVVGMFVNTLVLRVDLAGASTFSELLRRARTTAIEAFEHQAAPFEKVVEALQPRRDMSRSPLFQVMFVVQSSPMPAVALGDLSVELLDVGAETTRFDLRFCVEARGAGQVLSLQYNTDLFDPQTADELVASFAQVAERALRAPDAPLAALVLTPEERRRALITWNATEQPYPDHLCLHEPFFARASEQPDAIAVVAGGRRLTYAELRRRALAVSDRVQRAGLGRGQLVAIAMHKGWEQVAAALGVLHAGAAYLPIDPALPRERLWHLLEHGEARVALTQSSVDALLDWPDGVERVLVDTLGELDEAPCLPQRAAPVPSDLAYVIYTSGSTGQPKGVMIDHRGALNTILDVNRRFGVGRDDRVLALSSLSFDLSVYDLFGTLAAGGTIVLPPPGAGPQPDAWAAIVREEGVTVWNSVPALLQLALDAAPAGEPAPDLASLRLVMLSGDWIDLKLPERIRAASPAARIVSLGGATEASIWSILHPIDGGVDPRWRSVPYGRPMANQRVYVLDKALEPCPVGVAGELYIGGVGVALGYWRDEARTAARFVAHPTHPAIGERLYRTGDLGRYFRDGAVELLGRADFQVKVRGFRVELGEIEAVLLRHPDVREAVVAVRQDPSGDRRLVAYVIGAGALDPQAILGFARRTLPEYMVPSACVPVDAFPLSANGKVDRAALAAIDPRGGDSGGAPRVPPRTEAERAIVGVLKEVLQVEQIGVNENLFEIGLTSLLAVRAQRLLNGRLRAPIAVADLFQAPTIEALAARVDASGPARGETDAAEQRADARREAARRRQSLRADRSKG